VDCKYNPSEFPVISASGDWPADYHSHLSGILGDLLKIDPKRRLGAPLARYLFVSYHQILLNFPVVQTLSDLSSVLSYTEWMRLVVDNSRDTNLRLQVARVYQSKGRIQIADAVCDAVARDNPYDRNLQATVLEIKRV